MNAVELASFQRVVVVMVTEVVVEICPAKEFLAWSHKARRSGSAFGDLSPPVSAGLSLAHSYTF
jgi:hypothetical protein